MRLYETFGKTGFHTCIATSFGIDFDAYENVVLARLRGAGCHNNLLAVDARMLTLALDGGSGRPVHAGRIYSVIPVGGLGFFHPKVTLQLGRSSARLIVSSANITAAGLAGNLEVAGAIEAEDAASGEMRLIASAWRFLSRLLDPNLEGVSRQIDWMRARTPWLRNIDAAPGAVELSDGTMGAFFASDDEGGIAERFLECLSEERVRRLIVISPYWDEDLAALNFLLGRMEPAEACLLLDHGYQVFRPGKIARGQRSRVKLIDFKPMDKSRFIHAKVVIAQTARQDHVLYGSANCTWAALSGSEFKGRNAEACLYRGLPGGLAVEALGLSDALECKPIPHSEFRSAEPEGSLPLAELDRRFPGYFTCRFDTLIWSPPAGADPELDRIELLNRDATPLASAIQRIDGGNDGTIRFRLTGKEPPTFARVRRSDGSLSALGIVSVLDELRDAVKDARTRRIDAALSQLDGGTELGLWLLETLDELMAAEAALRGAEEAPIRRTRTNAPPADKPSAPEQLLTYKEFIAGRRLRSEAAGHRNSFAGSHVSGIRGFLNRLLRIGESEKRGGEEQVLAPVHAFDLGDETANPDEAVEGGLEFEQASQRPGPVAEDGDQLHSVQAARQRRVNRDELVGAVAELEETIAEKAKGNGLRPIDLLRMRAMLMILAAAAWDGTTAPENMLQVLPPSGDRDAAWPRLLGKVLFTYFGGQRIAIRTLVLDGFYDQIPDDVLECWATCMWAIQTVALATARYPEYRGMTVPIGNLRSSIYRTIALRQDELTDARILRVLEALTARFGMSMNLDGSVVLAVHERTAALMQAASRQTQSRG
jgi:hypothetical protein